MILITGGAFQGKRAYLHDKLPELSATEGSCCTFEEALRAECIADYQILVRRLSAAGLDPIVWTEQFCAENPNCVVLMNEIGSGIIPMEHTERIWREQAGQCGCIIAAQAACVIRLICGIPSALKGALL